jgi:hypothetical protein
VSDERIECVECRRVFIWSSGEQDFYREHDLSHPKRCPDYRSQRRADRQSGMRGLAGPPPPATAEAPAGLLAKLKTVLKRLLS